MFIIDPGEGAGNGGTGDGIEPPQGGGGDSGNANALQGTAGASGGDANPPSDTVNVPKDVFDKIANSVEHMENMHAINAAVTGIKSEIPDFDLGKVHAKLEEMHKTDPEGAKALNHPAGWKMLWKSEIAEGDVKADGVNGGRKTSGDNRRDLVDRIRSGEADAGERASLLEKYL